MTDESPPLTDEQLGILRKLALGLSYKQIAFIQHRRPLAISRMLRRAMVTLGAETPMQGMALFIAQYGMPEGDDNCTRHK